MNLYTPPGGLTPQAQSTQTFYNALQGITGMTPSAMSQSDLQSGQNQAMAQSLSLGANQGQAMQNAKTQLSQQAGVPALQNQFGDLSGAFQMWLADQNLAQKYSSGQNTNPWDNAGLVAAGNGNPYMAPAEQIINSTQTQNSGFTSPSLTTAAMGAPMYATTNFLNLLNAAIIGQQGVVNNNLNTYSNNYAGAMDALGKVADMFGNTLSQQQSEADKARQMALDEAKSGLRWDSTTNQYIPIQAGVGDLSQFKTKAEQAQYIRNIYNASTTDSVRKQIATRAKELGISLSPKDPTKDDMDRMGQDIGTINSIQNILDIMNKYPNDFAQGFAGTLKAKAIQSGLAGALESIGAGGVIGTNPDVDKAIGDMVALRVEKERLMGGIRAAGSPQMYQKLSLATPGPEKSIETNKKHMQTLLEAAKADLDILARKNQYVDSTDMTSQMGIQVPDVQIGSSQNNVNNQRQDIINKLKAAKYNDDQIHEYLRMKGIDK